MAELEMPWGTMFYAQSDGSGVPVVFLHGTGCDAADWGATIAALPAEMHTVLIDFRGHGHSDVPTAPFTLQDLADDVLHLIDRRGFERAILAGHSLGGMVALAVTRASPNIAGLVLLEGWTSLSAARAFDDGRFYGTIPRVAIAQIQHKMQATRARFTPLAWAHFWSSVERFDAFEPLERVAIPIVEAYGQLGRNAETEMNLRVPPNPHIEWFWIPNAGHYLPHERPRQVAAACQRCVQRVKIAGVKA
jgi:pimeloyl-ACP methyl ester carboxylesterase